MRTIAVVSSLTAVLLGEYGQVAGQTPSFRTVVEVAEIDVVVTRSGSPVTDLAIDDFEVEDRGKRTQLLSVEYVSYRSADDASRRRQPLSAPDAPMHSSSDGRVVVIVYDDLYAGSALTAGLFQRVKTIGRAIIDRLGPDDEAAVVGVTGGSKYQSRLTRDKERLRLSFDQPALYDGTGTVLDTLLGVMDTLQSIPHRRKLVFLIAKDGLNFSASMQVGSDGDPRLAKLKEMQMRAARGRTVLYAVGAREPGNLAAMALQGAPDTWQKERRGYTEALSDMRTLPESTGGRTVADTNFLAEGVARIFEENAGFYVLRFHADRSDAPEFRKVTVKAKRRGLQVRARAGYWTDPVR